MKHALIETRSALPIETRSDDNTNETLDDAARAVAELRTAATTFETRLTEQLTALTTRLDAIDVRSQRPGSQQETNDDISPERRAFANYLRSTPQTPIAAEELRTLVVSSDPQGGYLAPKEMATEFIRDLVLVSPVRAIASVRTTGAPSVSYPKRTAITNAKWKGETQAQEGSEPAFGQAEIVIREVNTYVDISNQLLADSGGEAEAEVRLALSDDFGQKEARAFVNGNGVVEPEGFMTNADIGYVPGGHASLLQPDGLVKHMYSLPAQYRNQGAWGMNGTTLALVRLLKDGQGNYLWQPSFQAGQPETILGRPVVEMPDMPDVAANSFPIIFGDFSGYRIVDRISLSILVNPYLLATNGITRIHATRRVGAGVLQSAKFKKLKIATA